MEQITDCSSLPDYALKHINWDENYWIGIRRKEPRSNEWIYGGTTEKAEYLNFHPGRPDNYGGDEDCVNYVYVNKNWWHQWNDFQAWRELRYICEKDNCIDLVW